MHGVIRDRLEEVLRRQDLLAGSEEVNNHLTSCEECAREVAILLEQSCMVQSLRAEVEPSAGFYARVMQRIEEHAQNTIWAVFLYSPFGKRLAFASLALALLLGTYVVGMESQDGHMFANSAVEAQQDSDAPVHGDSADKRDAVLVNFVSYNSQTN
jgi:anti-sigma factor RsiW